MTRLGRTGGGARERRAAAGVVALAVTLGALVVLLGSAPLAAAADPAPTTTSPSCPASNPPNELTLVGGTPQTAKLDSTFSVPFEVALANSNGCAVTTAVAGTQVSFSAPSSGPSGTFAASGSSTATVGADVSGSASAGMFTGNELAGSYTVTASSQYGSVSFGLTNTAAGIAATISEVSPTRQASLVNSRYGGVLEARVLDANGNPAAGASVTFALASSAAGGSNAAGGAAASNAGASFDGGGTQATVVTDSTGIAHSPGFTANGVAGPFTATASTPGVTEPASFALVNVATKPARITPTGPVNRSATVETQYGRALQVTVTADNGKQRLQGVAVTFALGASGGGGGASGAGAAAGTAGASFVGGATQTTVTTGLAGRATSPLFTANGVAGTFTATATVPGSKPVSFSLENLAGRSPVIRLVGGARRSAPVESRYRRALQVKVLGANGSAVQGATVTFTLGSGGGGQAGAGAGGAADAGASFLGGSTQASETTSASGLATSPLFTADGTAGTFAATAAVAGVTNPASFTLENLAGRPPTIRLVGGRARAATIDTRYRRPLGVRVVGADGKPVQGATVTFTLGSGGGGSPGAGAGAAAGAGASFLGGSTQASETTSASGLATSPLFTAGATAGAFSATAAVSGVTNPVSFTLDNVAAKPPTITAAAAPSGDASATVGERYRAPLVVRVLGADRKPVQGATVTFTLGAASGGGAAASSSAGASFLGGSAQATETTSAAGLATSPAFAADTTAGTFSATASISGTTTVASFRLRNVPGPPTTVTAGAAANEAISAGTRFPIRLAVTVEDKHGNPEPRALVRFSAPANGPSGSFTDTRGATNGVTVRTNASGIAVAPAFTANQTQGGYIVKATVIGAGAAAAAFALVNEPPTP